MTFLGESIAACARNFGMQEQPISKAVIVRPLHFCMIASSQMGAYDSPVGPRLLKAEARTASRQPRRAARSTAPVGTVIIATIVLACGLTQANASSSTEILVRCSCRQRSSSLARRHSTAAGPCLTLCTILHDFSLGITHLGHNNNANGLTHLVFLCAEPSCRQ